MKGSSIFLLTSLSGLYNDAQSRFIRTCRLHGHFLFLLMCLHRLWLPTFIALPCRESPLRKRLSLYVPHPYPPASLASSLKVPRLSADDFSAHPTRRYACTWGIQFDLRLLTAFAHCTAQQHPDSPTKTRLASCQLSIPSMIAISFS